MLITAFLYTFYYSPVLGQTKKSIVEYFKPIVKEKGIAAAITEYHQQRTELIKSYDISEGALNDYGYGLMNGKKTNEAVEIFKLIVKEFPNSANAWDSFAEANMLAGNKDIAIKYYEKSIELNPRNYGAMKMLNKIKGKIKFSVQEVKQDLQYLYKTLEESHYNLYMHTKKEVFDKEFMKINNSINDSLTMLQIKKLVAPFVGLAKHGHCRLEGGLDGFDEYRRNNGTLFPFDIFFQNGRVMIEANYSNNQDIVKGDEILSINGRAIEKVKAGIYRHLSGESDYNKNSKIEDIRIAFLYWLAYGEEKVYDIIVKKANGRKINIKINAIPVSDFLKNSVNKNESTSRKRELKFIGNVAYLHPGPFYNIGQGEEYNNSEFVKFINSSFAEIAKNKAADLIIDIRNNPGGDDSFTNPMVAYFATKPFHFYSKFSYRTSRITKEIWKDLNVGDNTLGIEMKKNILSGKDGDRFYGKESMKYQPRTDSLKFKGNVFVLIDRYTWSAATGVAAMIQDFGFAYLIGEETSDTPSSCGATHSFILPNTIISVTYPKGYTIRPNGNTSLRGTVPDFKVMDNVLTQKDEILDYALKLIKEKKYKTHKMTDKSIK